MKTEAIARLQTLATAQIAMTSLIGPGKAAAKKAGMAVKSVDEDGFMLMFTVDKKKKPTSAQLKAVKDAMKAHVKAPFKIGDFKLDPDGADMVDDPDNELLYTMVFYQ